jgi:septum site-determining protein MinD
MLSVLDPESIAGILPHDMVLQQAAKEGTLIHVDQQTPFFQALEQTVRYIESGTAPCVSSLTALLPLCEGNSATAPERPVAAEVPSLLKGSAIAELQQAAAILHGQPGKAAPVTADGADDVQEKGLSVRQRRQQSMAWRHYHR